MNNTQANEIIDNFPLDRYTGLNTIGVSDKLVNGQPTGEKCIVFGVSHKMNADQITPDQMLPSMIEHDGEMIRTDVTQDDGELQFEAEFCPHVTNQQIDQHKMKVRPLQGGVSVGNGEQQHRFKVGTLGMLVRDELDGEIVGLSNNHVLTPDIFSVAGEQQDMYNFKNVAVYQPARAEIAGRTNRDHRVGSLKRVYPLRNTRRLDIANEIDAAIFSIDRSVVLQESSRSVLGLVDQDGVTPVTDIPFAYTPEIDDALNPVDPAPLFKSSRTTGAVGSALSPTDAAANNQCSLRVQRTNYSAVVSGRRFKNMTRYWDPNESDKIDPSTGGDSGSVICAWIDSQWKAVGLHFAGTRSGGYDYGVMCRMDRIADLLRVTHVGDTNLDDHGYTQPQYKVIEGSSSSMYIEIDGVTYWQVGGTTEYAD